MNDTKRTQMPSLYDDLTPQTVLKILHKNKNDYVSRKTVWAVASLSFCVGSLAALVVFWIFFHSSKTVMNQSSKMDGATLSHQTMPLTDKVLPVAPSVSTHTLTPVISSKRPDSHPQSGDAKSAVLLIDDKPENDNIAGNTTLASIKPVGDQSIYRELSVDKSPTGSNPFKSLESDAMEPEPVKLKSKPGITKPSTTKPNTSTVKADKAKANTSVAKTAKTKSSSATKKAQVKNKTSLKKIPDKKTSQPDQIEQLIMQLNKARDKKSSVQKAAPRPHN